MSLIPKVSTFDKMLVPVFEPGNIVSVNSSAYFHQSPVGTSERQWIGLFDCFEYYRDVMQFSAYERSRALNRHLNFKLNQGEVALVVASKFSTQENIWYYFLLKLNEDGRGWTRSANCIDLVV